MENPNKPSPPDEQPQLAASGSPLGVRPTNVRWRIFALACGTSWMLYLHRYTFALIKPLLKEEYGLGNDELGALDSAFALCYFLFQIPFGMLADVVGVRIVLTSLILIWSIGLAMHAWAPSTGVLWYARATLGLGQSGVFASMSRLTKTWYPAAVRTTVQGWAGVFWGRMGGMSSNLIFGTLMVGMLMMGWRESIYIFAALGVGLAIIFGAVFRNSPRQHPWTNSAEADLIEEIDPKHPAKPAKQPLTTRQMFSKMTPRSIINLLCLNAQTIFSTIADNIYSAWIPLFLYEVHELEFKRMGIFSALPLLGGAIGGAIGGILNDRLIRKTGNRRWVRSGVGMAGKGGAAVLLLVAMLFFYDRPYMFCGMLFFIKLVGDTSLTTTWGVVSDIGGRASASVFAFNNGMASIFSGLAPLMYGMLAEHVSWTAVFIAAGASYALCSLSWLAVNCTIPVMPDET